MHNIVENNLNRTTSELDLCILVTHYWNFSKSKGHNSAENYSTRPKFKLNLLILLTHLYTEFQFKMSISKGDNEQKLKINGIFLSPRGITLPKIIWPDPNSNSICILLWHIYICNGDNERKLKINGIFQSPRGITLPKIIRSHPNSNSTCVFSRHIYIPNFNWKCQFVMEIMSGNWKLKEFFKVQGA